jgi:hypothetical protein
MAGAIFLILPGVHQQEVLGSPLVKLPQFRRGDETVAAPFASASISLQVASLGGGGGRWEYQRTPPAINMAAKTNSTVFLTSMAIFFQVVRA